MTSEPILSRNPDVVFRSIEGGGVLLNSKTGAYHEVNSTARNIWESLETPSTEAEVLEKMMERYGEVPDLGSDLSEFIRSLTERDLVLISDPQ